MTWSKTQLLLPLVLVLVGTLLFPIFTAPIHAITYNEYANYTSGDDNSTEIYYDADWPAQTFNTTTSYTINAIRLKLYREGSAGSLTVGIRATNSSGYPTGTDLCSGTYAGSWLSDNTSGTWRDIAVSGYTLAENTTYAIVASGTGMNAANNIHWLYDSTAATYNGGSAFTSPDGGTTWSQDTNSDYMFAILGTPVLEILGAQVFSGYLEEGDWLIVAKYRCAYEPYYQDQHSKDCFLLQLYRDVDVGAWVSPNGYTDVNSTWSDETDAYDEDTTTFALSTNTSAPGWGTFLELNTTAINCSKARFCAGHYEADPPVEIDLDVHYGSAWHDVYQGGFTRNVWVEKSLGGTYSVDKARVRLNHTDSVFASLNEFDFWQTDNSTTEVIAAQVPLPAWGYRPASLYLSAASVASLEWGSAYPIRLYGAKGTHPTTEYVLTAADWRGSNLEILDDWCLLTAASLEDYYGSDLVTPTAIKGDVLNNEGSVIFATGIPYLNHARPDIFETAIFEIEYDEATWGYAYEESLPDWEAAVGPEISSILNDAGIVLNLDGDVMGGIFVFVMFAALAAVALSKGHGIAGVALGMPLLFVGFYFKLIPLAVLGVAIAIVALLLVWHVWWRST